MCVICMCGLCVLCFCILVVLLKVSAWPKVNSICVEKEESVVVVSLTGGVCLP